MIFFQVLAPCGPLRILEETAQKRNEQIEQVFPSLIYSSGVTYTLTSMADRDAGFSQEWVNEQQPMR